MMHLSFTAARRYRLLIATGMVALAASFGFGTVSRASAAPNLIFTVQQPNGAEVCVQFTSGVSSILQTTATGTDLAQVFTALSGFCVMGKNTGPDDATVQMLAATNSATIDATAQVQGSSSLSYSIGNGPSTPVANGDFTIPLPLGATAGGHRSVPLRVGRSRVRVGRSVTIEGTAPARTRVGRTVLLLSDAFPARHAVRGVPAIKAKVRADGRYRTKVTIPVGRRPGAYLVQAQLGTRILGVATLRVRR